MSYVVRHTTAFKRDYKLAIRRNLPIEKLQAVVAKLQNGEELPPANRDHALTGPWANHRECLVLELTRTGTHSDLFGK